MNCNIYSDDEKLYPSQYYHMQIDYDEDDDDDDDAEEMEQDAASFLDDDLIILSL